MSDPKTNSILDEANRLFLKGKIKESIHYYDKILELNPTHLGSLNNKGYALSKLKDYSSALQFYERALKINPNDLSVLINKISTLRKQKQFEEALSLCDDVLESNPDYNVVLYHKERILFSLDKFRESINCCDKILNDYPFNGDVLFDKAANYAMLSELELSLKFLEEAIHQSIEYKIKAKKSSAFTRLENNLKFQKLVS